MFCDAHCHPCDLFLSFPHAGQETENKLILRTDIGVIAAASAWNPDEFAYNEELAHNADGVGKADRISGFHFIQCFAVHPQLPAGFSKKGRSYSEADLISSMEFLCSLAEEKKIAAVGETGFDLFNDLFRETETIQEKIFSAHLEAALNYGLPVVIHVRRAMHKIFSSVNTLSKCKAVIFHSWPGTCEEAASLLRRGVNSYFSFGNAVMLNHKQAIRSCALLPADRILTETDAPYQPRRGREFSYWTDIPLILETAASLRCEAGSDIDAIDLESQIEINFKNAFGLN